jgi:hypothetical protein
MSALMNYLKKAGLVNEDTVDEEQAARQLQDSINEMLLAMSRHHAGSGCASMAGTMGALLNYLKKAGLVNEDTVDEEQACRQLQESINEMMLATARHHAGSAATSRGT